MIDSMPYLTPIVDPSWLQRRLGQSGLRTVDLRDWDAYLDGHIPGAVHLELSALGSGVGGCDSVILSPEKFESLMSSRGISNGDAVVAYDAQWGLAAARLLWALHHYGHSTVAVLNGGWDRWVELGGASTEGEEHVAPGRFEAAPRADVYADTEWIVQRMKTGAAALLDTRTSAEFDDGHIPGAISWDWFNAVPADSWNVSRDPEELRGRWRALGLDPSEEVIVYCNSGMRAAHTYLVLRNAGFDRVRLYDGSWQAWSMSMEDRDGR